MAKEGALVGWKFRNALIFGHVKAVDGDMLRMTPVSKAGTEVHRKREKVLLEDEMDPSDVQEGLKRGGHLPRTETKSQSAKAMAIGLSKPHQMMPEGEARKAKRAREHEYKKEAESRKAPKGRGGRKKGGKAAVSEEEDVEEEAGEEKEEEDEEEEEEPSTPSPTKARGGRSSSGGGSKKSSPRRKKGEQQGAA